MLLHSPFASIVLPAFAGPIAVIGDEGRWVPGIGDPTPMGWVTVGAYLVAAGLCGWWAIAAGGGRRTVPAAIAILMVLLAINKQLDLQSLLTQTGRDLLKDTGLYGDHRTLQAIFIGVFAAVGLTGLAAMLWGCRRRLGECWLALTGLTAVVVFVTIRAASFHKVDSGLGQELAGMRLNWILELGGIGLVSAGGLIGRWRNRSGLRGRSRPAVVGQNIAPDPSPAATSDDGGRGPAPSQELPRIVRPAASEQGPETRGPADGFVVRPIRISDGPAIRRARRRQDEERRRDDDRDELGPRRLVP
jgi:hypothetical protein